MARLRRLHGLPIAVRLRLGALLAVSLITTHDAVYLAQYGLGGRLSEAMSARGHDGYWLTISVLTAMIGILAIAGVGRIAWRLRRRLRMVEPSKDRQPYAPYLPEVLRLWRIILPVTVLLFAVQENVEFFVANGDILGVDALVGPVAPLALPVIALVTFALAAIGGLVRWRIAVLEARLARATARPRAVIVAVSPPPEWRHVHAVAPHRWMRARLDAGRAPPGIVPA